MTIDAGRGAEAPPEPPRDCPYVGLEPYSESDAPFFFGREREQRIITANLRSSRLTLLYGASGMGKSSVLKAGVIHALRQRVRANLAAQAARPRPTSAGEPLRAPFAIAEFSAWRDPDPLGRLVECVRGSAEQAIGEKVDPWTAPAPVSETLQAWTGRVRTLLVVLDQFEEYFLYHPDDGGEGSFDAEFPRLVNEPNLHVNFLISIREDAWAKLDRFKGRVPQLFSNYLRVRHLDPAAARRAIEGPVEEYNRRRAADEQPFAIEPSLVDAVLREVSRGGLSLAQSHEADEPAGAHEARAATQPARDIETPFLQLIMTRLWEHTRAKGLHELRAETLTELGGARRIVSSHLDDSLAGLDRDEQAIAAEAFRFLVTPAKTKIAQSAADLAYWMKRGEEPVVALLERLSRSEHGRILRPLGTTPGEELAALRDLPRHPRRGDPRLAQALGAGAREGGAR